MHDTGNGAPPAGDGGAEIADLRRRIDDLAARLADLEGADRARAGAGSGPWQVAHDLAARARSAWQVLRGGDAGMTPAGGAGVPATARRAVPLATLAVMAALVLVGLLAVEMVDDLTEGAFELWRWID